MPKQVVIVAGANGSGKTTFANQYVKRFGYQYVGADDIAAQLAPDKFQEVKIQAGRMFFKQLTELISKGKNFVVETTLSGLGFQRLIPRLNQAGYTITIVFIYLPTPENCIKRVKERVLKGGHSVPEVEIKRRFHRSNKNFWQNYKNQADYWHLFYNATDGFIEVAAGKANQFYIINETLFKLFLEVKHGK
jgi:predicted ABC-type ATPase